MQAGSQIVDISRVIQLSIAPVFLLTGVASLLGVMSGRLGRTIDRARVVEAMLVSTTDQAKIDQLHGELEVASRRAKIIYRGIAFGTTSALLVCVVIVSLYVSALLEYPISKIVGTLFILAMFALIAALVSFMREVFLATRALRIGPR